MRLRDTLPDDVAAEIDAMDLDEAHDHGKRMQLAYDRLLAACEDFIDSPDPMTLHRLKSEAMYGL